MRIVRLVIQILLATAWIVPLVSCASAPSASQPQSEEAAATPTPSFEVQVGEAESATAKREYIERYQPDIRLGARWEKGVLLVSVLNKSGREIEIGPASLGVIVENQLYRAKPGDVVAEFPVVVLAPDEGVSGRIRFLKLGDLTGGYCVFNHPDVRPSRCTILGAAVEAKEPDSPKVRMKRPRTP